MTNNLLRPCFVVMLLLCTTSCTTISKPKVIEIDRPAYVKLPDELLKECPAPLAQLKTNADLARYALDLKYALQVCNSQIDGIRKLQDK